MTRALGLLAVIALSAVGCSGSGTQEPEVTGTIAFIRGEQLWVMGADGSGQRALTAGRMSPRHPAWSPKRRTIAFGAWDPARLTDLQLINADGCCNRRLTRHRVDEVEPVWSPDGRRIALSGNYDGMYAIWVVNAGGVGRGERRVTAPGSRFTGPVWSPDGRRIAFTDVDGRGVYVMNRDGSAGGRRVLARATRARSIAWSPDGGLIAFGSSDGLWTMNVDGSGRRKLVPSPPDEIVWSPDGRTIAFAALDGDAEIFVVNRDGSGLGNLTENSGVDDRDPVWSPDGRAIAFVSDRDGNSEIYVMNADGSGQQNVSESPLPDHSPDWSPGTAP